MMQTAYLKKTGLVAYLFKVFDGEQLKFAGFAAMGFYYNPYNKTLTAGGKTFKNVNEIVFDF
jgi:hypothetical protein